MKTQAIILGLVMAISLSSSAMAQNLLTLPPKHVKQDKYDWFTSYEIKFSNIFPAEAEKIRQIMKDRVREELGDIAQLKRRGQTAEAQDRLTRLHRKVQSWKNEVNAKYPKTTITVWGDAVKSDMKTALEFLKRGKYKPGQHLHVYLVDGHLRIRHTKPSEYDKPLAKNPSPQPVKPVRPIKPGGDLTGEEPNDIWDQWRKDLIGDP
ncbi:hypothetical protein [Bremerella sp. P1]|uniref:hypothetical protein n=1 Tax=Bremerella sp. P1 TaxID=3026424 RepID=UPI002368B863|nr:hypothetical protein [Bremerella sp. P1]WDI43804.1 hypothetical protein PSR63_07565 [Bremerella sp. P1]